METPPEPSPLAPPRASSPLPWPGPADGHWRDTTVGAIVVAGCIGLAVIAWGANSWPSASTVVAAVSGWPTRTFTRDCGRLRLRVGDPVFLRSTPDSAKDPAPDGTPAMRLVGFVTRHDGDACHIACTEDLDRFGLRLHQPASTPAAIARTLLPPARRAAIGRIVSAWTQQHAAASATRLLPILRDAMAQSLPIIQRSVRSELAAQRKLVGIVGDHLQTRVIDRHLIPVAKTRVLPIVRRHAERPALSIGRELWNRASLWRFAWAAVANRSGLPDEDRVAAEWQRFVDEEAIEVFEDHADVIADAVRAIVVDAAADPAIRDGLRQAGAAVLDDPATDQLITLLVRRCVVQNQELHRVWVDALSSDRAKQAYAATGESLQPMLRQINDVVLGSARSGLTDEFVAVLRREVLAKDRRWIEAVMIGDDGSASRRSMTIGLAADPRPIPVLLPESRAEPTSDDRP